MSGEGWDVGEEASQWVSQFLGRDGCRLYYMAPENKARKLKEDSKYGDFAAPEDEVCKAKCEPNLILVWCVQFQSSFSDWGPVLIISEASLEQLNSKLETALPMDRFRPNIVISGCLPHAEVFI